MNFTIILSAAAAISAVAAAPYVQDRQSSCPEPTEVSCKELHDRCVIQGASVLSDPWDNRICVAAATCYGVGNLLTSYACRLGVTTPTPSNLPSLSTTLFPNPITQQNYVDFYYGSINAAWPSSVNVVTDYWAPIISWINRPDSSATYLSLLDWLHLSSSPSAIPTSSTSQPNTDPVTPTPTNTSIHTPTHTSQMVPGIVTTCHHDVAITFDGSGFDTNKRIVNLFDANMGKTTFFVSGNIGSCIYDSYRVKALRYAFEHGHTIGAQSWFSDDISVLDDDQLGAELDRIETALWKILGIKPALFRSFSGNYTQHNINYLNSRGYTVVSWDLDTDYQLGVTASQSMQKVRALAHDTSMIRLNEDDWTGLTPQMISYLKSSLTSKLVTVDQCLDISAYQVAGSAYQIQDDSWTCR